MSLQSFNAISQGFQFRFECSSLNNILSMSCSFDGIRDSRASEITGPSLPLSETTSSFCTQSDRVPNKVLAPEETPPLTYHVHLDSSSTSNASSSSKASGKSWTSIKTTFTRVKETLTPSSRCLSSSSYSPIR